MLELRGGGSRRGAWLPRPGALGHGEMALHHLCLHCIHSFAGSSPSLWMKFQQPLLEISEVLPQSMYIFKQPVTGSEVTSHQERVARHTTMQMLLDAYCCQICAAGSTHGRMQLCTIERTGGMLYGMYAGLLLPPHDAKTNMHGPDPYRSSSLLLHHARIISFCSCCFGPESDSSNQAATL